MEGQLPWSDARSDADCKSRKMACNIVDLALQNNCPEVMIGMNDKSFSSD